MLIWICHVHHKHGDNHYAGLSRDEVVSDLEGYVIDNWHTDEIDHAQLSQREKIDAYFDWWASVGGEEWSEIVSIDLGAGVLEEGIDAATAVVESWESGDLAGAVAYLNGWRDEAVDVLNRNSQVNDAASSEG